jgi:hypothetical protein
MQEEEVGNILLDQETLCVCAPFFVFLFSFLFFVSYILFFPERRGLSRRPTRRKVRREISESHCSSATNDFRLLRAVFTAFALFLYRFSPTLT